MSRMTFGACFLVASVTVGAQTSAASAPVPPVPPTPPVAPVPPAFPFGAGDDMMRFVSSELGARSVIKDAPYSATAVNGCFHAPADPRPGERIYRLENIKREEPSAELFKVPADYELKAAPMPRDADRK